MILAVCMLFCIRVSVSAIEPKYTENSTISVRLTFSSNEALCYFKIAGGTGTESISDCDVTLKDSKGTTVKSWTDLYSTRSSLTFSESVSNLTTKETYTLSVTATINRNGGTEPISGSTSSTCT